MSSLEEFVSEYIDTMLWAENVDDINAEPDENGEREQVDADVHYDRTDIDGAGLDQIYPDCASFWEFHRELWRSVDITDEQAAHHFYLSRNGHGTGFWDRGLGVIGDQLHDAAKVYGTQGLMSNPDGTLSVHN